MNDEHVAKLYELFRLKMQDVLAENARPSLFGGKRIFEFNAWQHYLRTTLSLEVVDIEEGERPGLVRQKGQVVGVRITNPINRPGYCKEFIIVPYELAERCLIHQWIPNEWPPMD